MNETKKTAVFLSVALLLAVIAIVVQPKNRSFSTDAMLGKDLFEKFQNPLDVKGLDIVRFNPAKGDVEEFRISEVADVWVIPSHENYPADAKNQMAAVAESLVGLKVLSVVLGDGDSKTSEKTDKNVEKTSKSTAAQMHALYGVLDPTTDSVAGTPEDIGLKIIMTGKDDSSLVDLIVGKSVEGAEGVRYVRVAGSTPVFTVMLDPTRFSTKFEDWIQKNVLDIQSWDVQKILMNDYSVDILKGTQTPGGIMEFEAAAETASSEEPRWKLSSYKTFRGNQYVDTPLGAEKNVDTSQLDSLLSAVESLKIVDVSRKSDALVAALKEAKSFALDNDSRMSLAAAGFYLVAGENGKPELLSNDGELVVVMKDGVKYTLRFGQLTGTESEVKSETDTSPDGEADILSQLPPQMQANRYLFVMAELDNTAIPAPELQPLPEIPTEGEPASIEAVQKDRDRLEKSNQREQDRYDVAMVAAKRRIADLNYRFADWYFVIADSEYRKIHLDNSALIRDVPTAPDSLFPRLPGMGGLFPIVP